MRTCEVCMASVGLGSVIWKDGAVYACEECYEKHWARLPNVTTKPVGTLVSALRKLRQEAVDVVSAIKVDGGEPKPLDFPATVTGILAGIGDLLVRKNQAYGNSALEPVRVFSQGSPVEQILVRIDDKLSRIARGFAAGEDIVDDLIGYLVILKVARQMGQSD